MNYQQPDNDEEEVDLKYEGGAPQNELISYKNMLMEMNRSAVTDGSCLSLVTVACMSILGILLLSIFFNLFLR